MPKDIMHEFKCEEKRAAAAVAAGFIDDTLPYFIESPIVTFVPSASSHKRQRGFEHTELIAKELCKMRGWNYARVLHRKGQARQVGANRATRKAQIKDAFIVVNPSLIKNQHVLLIDDVVTNSATIEACTHLLKSTGDAEVSVAVFARTPENRAKG